MESKAQFRFSLGPWNIHDGAEVFGPPVREAVPIGPKFAEYKKFGFDGVQLHDDDAVSDVDAPASRIEKEAREMKKMIDNEGLVVEFIAPRLGEQRWTVEGADASNDGKSKEYAADRLKKAIDIANYLGTKNIVLWPARECVQANESNDHVLSTERFVTALNTMLYYDKDIRILGEMKPNEPMDHIYAPATGHFLSLCYRIVAPERVGVLIESAYAILAGLDPAMEMGFAIYHDRLWSVHLNDQSGLKFDEDRDFGAINLKRAFDQVLVLFENNYGAGGEFVGFDVKALCTQKSDAATSHLLYSRQVFLDFVELIKSMDMGAIRALRASRNYEELEQVVVEAIMG